MPMKLLSADDFRSAAKAGERPEGTVFRFATTEPEQVGDEAARTQRFVFSDATVDHSGDSIDPKGWDLGIFKRNPVALFSHMSWDPPIGRASNVGVKDGALVGDIEFATADIYEFADTIYRLVKGKFLNAVSVGFIPTKWSFTNDQKRPCGIDFEKQTLLEISVCPVPCNPNALGEARSLGVDTRPLVDWAEKVLDSGDTAFLPRKELEALRGQAGGVERRFYIQSEHALSKEAATRIRDEVKRWQQDPHGVLVLDKGMTLRTTSEDWTCGAALDLPLDKAGAWDGAAAEASIFDHAGGDDFNPTIARQGFLACDASAPQLRGSYKLPFAQAAGGKLTAMASGIRAAASRLPDSEIPDAVAKAARAVLDHYEAQMTTDGAKSLNATCGRAKEATCGMVDPQECSVHATPAKSSRTKAGRRISAANKAMLDKAMEYHAEMGKCIQAVMSSDDPDDDNPDDDDNDPDAAEQRDAVDAQPAGANELDDLSPEERRMREVRALKASLPAID